MGRKALELAGQRFGRLLVIDRHPNSSSCGHTRWNCRCDCGQQLVVAGNNLKSGNSNSCGCLQREMAKTSNTTHGLGHVDEYSVWSGMIQRCTNPNSEAYDNYAGRGIFVCDRWMSFENFYADMGPRPSPMHSLDRIINDQGYNPENCRWATRVVQNNNTRSNRLIEYKGQMYTLSQLSQLPQVLANGISYNTLLNRLTAQGMDVETAITQPVRRKRND